jgi:maltose/maltodextrin transport system substrate-binding protein
MAAVVHRSHQGNVVPVASRSCQSPRYPGLVTRRIARPICCIAWTLAVALALTGCPSRKTPEPVKLRWWITFAPDSAEYPALQSTAEAYTQKTGHAVELVSVPWDDIAPRGTTSPLTLALQTGTGPDLWGPVPHNWTSAFARDQQALVLEPAQIQQSNQYLDVALQACQVGQKQVALPVLMDTMALYYNKAQVPSAPATFDEMVAVARGLTHPDDNRWGLAVPLLSPFHIYSFVDGYGGYIFRCDAGQCQVADIGLNNEGAVKGTELLTRLYTKDRLLAEPLTDRGVMHERALELFTTGRAAMLIDGSWALSSIRASGLNYGIAPIPVLPDTTGIPRPLSTVQAIVVSSQTSHPGEAVELANHIASPESALALYQVWGKIPVRQELLRSSQFADTTDARVWRDQIARSLPLPNIPELGYVWAPWQQALEEAVPGYKPVQEALDQAVEQIKSLVASP